MDESSTPEQRAALRCTLVIEAPLLGRGIVGSVVDLNTFFNMRNRATREDQGDLVSARTDSTSSCWRGCRDNC